ncbi:hypothetical protein LZ31DRAFT_185613 [Colletotrichum somersetense]|nr:hypothetical protein LZ31DRAFT_185613 [Colletotrichum somersetense]
MYTAPLVKESPQVKARPHTPPPARSQGLRDALVLSTDASSAFPRGPVYFPCRTNFCLSSWGCRSCLPLDLLFSSTSSRELPVFCCCCFLLLRPSFTFVSSLSFLALRLSLTRRL